MPRNRRRNAPSSTWPAHSGVGHVNVGLLQTLPFELVVSAFAGLCDRVGEDLIVALEPMPYGVRDLVPADAIASLQLNDVRRDPMDPPRMESLHHRLPPGEGYADPVGIVRALRARGCALA